MADGGQLLAVPLQAAAAAAAAAAGTTHLQLNNPRGAFESLHAYRARLRDVDNRNVPRVDQIITLLDSSELRTMRMI